jgi:hypothetical protein
MFEQKVVPLMEALLVAFPAWDEVDAAACAGNGGLESAGFEKLQEIKPTVKGSRGGFGWFQWTGPRRRAFEAWCKKMHFDPVSDQANIRYLITELRGSESATIGRVARAKGLENKVRAFEDAFERAGVKNFTGRIRYAKRALAAWQKAHPDRKPLGLLAGEPAITDLAVVKGVQEHLVLLGYTEVGSTDGKIGPMTRAAILAYRADNHLPMVAQVDDELIASFGEAKVRQLPAVRTEAHIKEIAPKVDEAKAHWWNKYIAGTAAAGTAVAGAVDYIAPAQGFVEQFRDYLTDVPTYVWLVGIAVVAGVMFYWAQRGQRASEDAYRDGSRR